MPRPDKHMKFFTVKPAFIAAFIALAAAAPARAQGLTLEAAMREAMAKSEESRLLEESDVRFKAYKREVLSDALPQVTGVANAGRGSMVFDPGAFGFNDTTGNAPKVINFAQNRYDYSVEVNQAIFTFGKLGKAVKLAGIQQDADSHSHRRSRQQLQLAVLDTYYGAVNSKARLASIEASARRYDETVGFLESNWKMGSGVRSVVLRAITAQKALEPARINARRDAEAARMMLNRLLGRELDAPLDLDTTAVPEMAVPAAPPDSQAVNAVLEERPDIRSMALQRRVLEGRADILRMGYLPSFGANAKWGVTAFKLNQLGAVDENDEWRFGVGMRWNLFDGFRSSSLARQFSSDARTLALNESQARKMTQVEIRSSFHDYQAADTALDAANQAVKAAQEAQAMLSEDFRAGKGQITDLLESEEALRNAELGVLGARYQRVRARAALRIALGKDLINEEAK